MARGGLQLILLAAGRGRRLGRDKPTLPWGGVTLVQHVLAQFPAALTQRRIVVCNPDNAAAVENLVGAVARVVVNTDPQGDMLSSVRVGCAAADSAGGPVCVHPVDVFALTPALVEMLYELWHAAPEHIHVPCVAGKRAHPALIPAALIAEIAAIPPGHGLNWLLRREPQRVCEHGWPDALLLGEIDTQQDYDQYRPHR